MILGDTQTASFSVHLVEIGAHAVGFVTQEQGGCRFFAINNLYRALEDQPFDSADTARSAALELRRDADPSLSVLPTLAT
ncbi:MAG TPA: hypothetical protein VEH76_00240 [Methylocystis sp.]|nr:hypothetical protein [Methylocystis sp.]